VCVCVYVWVCVWVGRIEQYVRLRTSYLIFFFFLLHILHSSGVALVSRIDKIMSLFCKRALQKRRYSAKETYNFIDPTDRSHPILYTIRLGRLQHCLIRVFVCVCMCVCVCVCV